MKGFMVSDEYLAEVFGSIYEDQVADVTEVANCPHCAHVHLILRNEDRRVIAVAAINGEIIDMIMAAREELKRRQQ